MICILGVKYDSLIDASQDTTRKGAKIEIGISGFDEDEFDMPLKSSEEDGGVDYENNESRKKVGQKLAFWENEYPDPVEK